VQVYYINILYLVKPVLSDTLRAVGVGTTYILLVIDSAGRFDTYQVGRLLQCYC